VCVVVNSHTGNISRKIRHFSIVENGLLDIALSPKSKSVRTILFSIKGVGIGSESMLDAWILGYKCLRSLDLSDSLFVTLPNSIVKLKYLHILNLHVKHSLITMHVIETGIFNSEN